MKICRYCGIVLPETAHPCQKYCPECAVIRQTERSQEYRRRKLRRNTFRKMKPLFLNVRAADAKQMSYGRYMAWKQEQEARHR